MTSPEALGVEFPMVPSLSERHSTESSLGDTSGSDTSPVKVMEVAMDNEKKGLIKIVSNDFFGSSVFVFECSSSSGSGFFKLSYSFEDHFSYFNIFREKISNL